MLTWTQHETEKKSVDHVYSGSQLYVQLEEGIRNLCVVNYCSCFRNFLTVALCCCMCPVMVAPETQKLEKKVHGRRRTIVTDTHVDFSVISLFNNALFISAGPYELGGVAMSHKKAGNEEAARRLRTNLKDVHWYVRNGLDGHCHCQERPRRSIYAGNRRNYFVISCYTISFIPEERCYDGQNVSEIRYACSRNPDAVICELSVLVSCYCISQQSNLQRKLLFV